MKRYLMIMGFAFALGACSSPSKTESTVTEEAVEAVETSMDSLAVEMDSVMVEIDSVIAE